MFSKKVELIGKDGYGTLRALNPFGSTLWIIKNPEKNRSYPFKCTITLNFAYDYLS